MISDNVTQSLDHNVGSTPWSDPGPLKICSAAATGWPP